MNDLKRALLDLWDAWGWEPDAWVIGLAVQSENPRLHLPEEMVQGLIGTLFRAFPHTRVLWLGSSPPVLSAKARDRTRLALKPSPALRGPLVGFLDGLIATEKPWVDLAKERGVPCLRLVSEEGTGLGWPEGCPWGRWPCGDRAPQCQRPDCLALPDRIWQEALQPWEERYQHRQFRPHRGRVEPWTWQAELSSERRAAIEERLKGYQIRWN